METLVIFGCDFCGKQVVAICPQKQLVELDDGTTVPIIRKPNKRLLEAPLLPEEQEYITANGRT